LSRETGAHLLPDFVRQEVYDPRDKEKRLARAYRLHSRVKVPSPAELTANVRTLLQAGAAFASRYRIEISLPMQCR